MTSFYSTRNVARYVINSDEPKYELLAASWCTWVTNSEAIYYILLLYYIIQAGGGIYKEATQVKKPNHDAGESATSLEAAAEAETGPPQSVRPVSPASHPPRRRRRHCDSVSSSHSTRTSSYSHVLTSCLSRISPAAKHGGKEESSLRHDQTAACCGWGSDSPDLRMPTRVATPAQTLRIGDATRSHQAIPRRRSRESQRGEEREKGLKSVDADADAIEVPPI